LAQQPNGRSIGISRLGSSSDVVARQSGSALKVDDSVDDSQVLELEKEGLINRIYKP
jgi:hypothetical protein